NVSHGPAQGLLINAVSDHHRQTDLWYFDVFDERFVDRMGGFVRPLLLLFERMTQLALVELCIDHTSYGIKKRYETDQKQSSTYPAHLQVSRRNYDLTNDRSNAAPPNESNPMRPTMGASPAVRGSSGCGGGTFSAI